MIFVQSNPGSDLKHLSTMYVYLSLSRWSILLFSISTLCSSIESVDKKNKVKETIRHENPTISKTKNVTKEYYKLTYVYHWWNGMLRKENVSVNGRFTKKNFWYLFSLGGNKERRLWGFPWLFFVSFVCLNTNSILDTPVVRVN